MNLIIRNILLIISLSSFMIACTETDYNRLHENAEVTFMATVNEKVGVTKNDTGLVQSASSVPTCELISSQGDSLWLVTSVSEYFVPDAVTKAAPVTDMYSTFKMYGYTFDGSWAESAIPNLMFAETVTKSGTTWKPSKNIFWMGKGKNIRFFAYAPVNQSGLTVLAPATATSAGSPTLTLTVPASVADQQDLLVCRTADLPDNTNTSQPLIFNHALSAVRFKAATDLTQSTITKITLKGVYASAQFSYASMSWTAFTSIQDFIQNVNIPVTGGSDITQPAQTFMMIPQILPAGAKIEVVIQENLSGFTRTLIAPIEGKVWTMGKTITYTVSSSALVLTPTLNVTAPTSYNYAGGSQNYTVTSYATNAIGEKFPVKWNAEFSTDGGTTWSTSKPTWLTAFTAAGNGNSTTGETYPATLSAQTGVLKTGTELLDQTVKGSAANPYDLSTNGGATSRNTANCYVVNGPGTYKIPLVFGNAIKNGVANTAAYNGNNFIGGGGSILSDPWIKNNIASLTNVTLVWQDVDNLVTDIQMQGDYITFNINSSTIRPGNAIIAVRSSDNYIRWSWHIWVTPWKIGDDVQIKTGSNIMSVNLGWVNTSTLTCYAARNAKVRFSQNNYAGYKYLDIIQSPADVPSESGYSPYYQWGRKDPQCPSTGIDNNRKTVYGPLQPGVFDITTDPGRGKVWGIIQPHIFFRVNLFGSGTQNNNNWCSDLNNNDWGYNSNVKTIYDPSPVGYKIPLTTPFSGLSRSGSWNNGQLFGSVGYTFFRALGVIHPNQGVYAKFGEGKYWTVDPMATQQTYYRKSFDFTNSTYDAVFERPSSAGCPIRAIKE